MNNNLDTQCRWMLRNKPMVPDPNWISLLLAPSLGPVFDPIKAKSLDALPITRLVLQPVGVERTLNEGLLLPRGSARGHQQPIRIPRDPVRIPPLGLSHGSSLIRADSTEKRSSHEIESDDELDRLLSKKTKPIDVKNTNIKGHETIVSRNNPKSVPITPVLQRQHSTSGSRIVPSSSRISSVNTSNMITSTNNNTRVLPVTQPLVTANVKSYTTEQLYQKYINFLELKTSLLTERYLTFESSSLSLDDKQKFLATEFEPQFNLIERNLIHIKKLLPLNIMTLSQLTEREAEVSQILQSDNIDTSHNDINTGNINDSNINLENTVLTVLRALDNVQVEDSLNQHPESDDDFQITQVNIIKDKSDVINLASDDNEFKVPKPFNHIDDKLSQETSIQNPVTPQRTNRYDRMSIGSPSDLEDDFGGREMEGLRTPTQEIDDADTDLSGFVVDEEEDEVTGSENESDYSLEESYVIDKDELNDIKLSQDVAENLGINYNFNNVANEIDDNENKDYEEVDDEFFDTQLNDEREVNHEVIEISDDDFDEFDDDLGLINPTIINPIIKKEPTGLKDKKTTDFDDFDDSDDDLLRMGITTSRDIIREQEQNHPDCVPFIKEIYHVLNKTFGLQNFRSNQFEAIINFLQGHDVFVLMPTGGGKSLCYQLPALIKVGKENQGVTIVISPLISLMKDQVEHLKKNNIRAEMINSKIPEPEKRATTDLFRSGQLDLIYLSPEMINASKSIQRIIQELYDSGLLNKIIVDEAHCISSWGHDFRPDYKGMNFFRKLYPDVPIMALTATANEKVKLDIIHLLNMKNPKILKQSFNRINLFYDIKMKTAGFIEEIRDLIVNKYRNKMGIIYCHSKSSCEQISQKLNQFGLETSFYHAGMSTEERFQVQADWQDEKIKVICATIAFGMGIDKPNVRFVIHSFIPRTLEGYYQETGRAGRDGLHSDCILYYSYRDARNLQMMIQRDEDYNETTKENHLNKLRQVIQYCENKHDCRRQQVLKYFNEDFNPRDCQKQCDACRNKKNQVVKDYTEIAKNMVKLVREIEGDRVTLLYCQDVFKGSNNAKIVKNGHNMLEYHGLGKSLTKLELERVFFHLVCENYLTEYSIMRSGFASNYVKIGNKANELLKGSVKVEIKFSDETVSNPTPPIRNPVVNNKSMSNSGFVSAKTNEPIRLPTNNFNNYVNPRNEKHIEKCYHELNLIRNKRRIELNFQNANNIISDDSLKKLAIMLPTLKVEFKKFVSNNDQLEYFIYFKTKLIELRKERKSLLERNLNPSTNSQFKRSQSQKKRKFNGKSAYFKKRRQKAMPL